VFQSISHNGGTNGIVLNTTGSSGGLTVTGTGGAGTGGTIQNCTGAGIVLTSTADVQLTSVNIQNCLDDGIRGSGVTGFSLVNCSITSNGNAVTERGVEILNLLGTASISNTIISGNAEDNLYIVNTSGTLTMLTVSNSTFSNTSATFGNDGIHFRGEVGSPNMSINVSNCTFANNRGDHFQVATDAANNAVISVVYQDNTMTGAAGNLGACVTLNTGGNSTTTFNISNNGTIASPWTGAFSSAITINTVQNATMSGAIHNNVIGNPSITDSGSASGDGINIAANATSDITVAVTNNIIREYSNLAGINVHVRDNGAGGGSIHATITGNTISDPGSFGTHGILAQAGAIAGDDHFLCIDIGGAGALANSIAGSGANGGDDFRIRQRILTMIRLPGYGGLNNNDAAVVSFIQGRNNGVESGSATNNVAGGGGGFVDGAVCNLP
jgi:hypothetical protein